MSKLTCDDCRAHLPDFCAGTLSRRRNRQVIKHLRQCDHCLRQAEQKKNKQLPAVPITTTAPHILKMTVPGKGQALGKWGAVLFILMMMVSLACFTYDTMTDEQVEEHVRTWVELRYPQGKLGSEEIDWTGWLPYYRHELHFPLLQQDDAGANRRLGTVVVAQRAWKREVTVSLNQPEPPLFLNLPGESADSADPPAAWEALEQLPQSVQVDMAFSTRHFLTPRAMVAMLDRYNTELLSVYAYGGETDDERRQFPPLALVLWTPQTGEISLEESKRTLLENVETVAGHPVLDEEKDIWEKRSLYVKEHGFRTYGALVRGTPQELLRLRDVLELQGPVIVDIDWVYAAHNRNPQRM